MGLKLSGAQGVGHCGSGGAQAKWLWNSEAGLMLMLTMMLILMMMTKTFLATDDDKDDDDGDAGLRLIHEELVMRKRL